MASPTVRSAVRVVGPSPDVRNRWQADLERAGVAVAGGPGTRPEPNAVLLCGASADLAETDEWLRRARAQWPGIPLLVAPRECSEDAVIACLRGGAADYLKPPACAADVVRSLARLGPAAPLPDDAEPCLVGSSEAMARVRAQAAQVAPTHATVLITGDTGAGKELLAELIHRQSPRRNAPLVRINCAALPDHLLESELFGWTRGAFTGAHAANPGKMELADGGTVLLDEIGDMSQTAQAKILRLIESREAQRLGGGTVRVDVRFLAATNQDVEQLTQQGRFRRDLYFRLKVARINLPRLRDRRDDIPQLLHYYLEWMNRLYGRRVTGFCGDAEQVLQAYDWPGNVRELRNLVEAVYLTSPGDVLTLSQVTEYLNEVQPAGPCDEGERDRVLAALSSARWNKSRAARQLQWSRMTLYRKMRQHHITDLCREGALEPAEPHL